MREATNMNGITLWRWVGAHVFVILGVLIVLLFMPAPVMAQTTPHLTVGDTRSSANTAPVLDLNGAGSGINHTATFTEGGGSVSIVDSANLTVTDDGNALVSATIKLANNLNGASEVLAVNTAGTGITANL